MRRTGVSCQRSATPWSDGAREHAHVLEAAEADEVIDGRAHSQHRQRLADARFDQLEHRRIRQRHARDFDAHVGDGAAEVLLGARALGAGSTATQQRRPRSGEQRRQQPRASERVPLADFERVGAVLVLRQHPRQRVALVELEQDDLVARRRRQAARVGQEDAVRDALADRDARRRVEVEARRLLIRIVQQRRDLERVDAEGLLDDAADFGRQRAGQRARRAGLDQPLLALVGPLQARPARCRRSAPGR